MVMVLELHYSSRWLCRVEDRDGDECGMLYVMQCRSVAISNVGVPPMQVQWTAEACVEQATSCFHRTTREAGKGVR